MSVHSVLRCASTAPTSPNYVAAHPCQSPCAASSDLATFPPAGADLSPARTKTSRAPKSRTRRSCLRRGLLNFGLGEELLCPNSWLHMPPSSPNASSARARPPWQKIGRTRITWTLIGRRDSSSAGCPGFSVVMLPRGGQTAQRPETSSFKWRFYSLNFNSKKQRKSRNKSG